jgi:hypothetical protein
MMKLNNIQFRCYNNGIFMVCQVFKSFLLNVFILIF